MPLTVIVDRFERYVRGDIVKEKDEERFRAHYPRLVEEMPEPVEEVPEPVEGVGITEEPSLDTPVDTPVETPVETPAETAPKRARKSTTRR